MLAIWRSRLHCTGQTNLAIGTNLPNRDVPEPR